MAPRASIDYKILGIRETTEQLKKLEQRVIKKVVRKATRVGTNVILKSVRQETPKDSGALRRATVTTVDADRRTGSIRGKVAVKRGKVVKVGRKANRRETIPSKIQHLVIGGTDAHDIRPSKAKSLQFNDRYAAQVKHPGTSPNAYFDSAFRMAGQPSIRAFTTEYNRGVNEQIALLPPTQLTLFDKNNPTI